MTITQQTTIPSQMLTDLVEEIKAELKAEPKAIL
jgi:hypothetical protein